MVSIQFWPTARQNTPTTQLKEWLGVWRQWAQSVLAEAHVRGCPGPTGGGALRFLFSIVERSIRERVSWGEAGRSGVGGFSTALVCKRREPLYRMARAEAVGPRVSQETFSLNWKALVWSARTWGGCKVFWGGC